MVYQYTPKKFAKIPKNTENSSKYTQNYTQVYFMPEIQRKWYTEYLYLSCNIPYTRFKKPLYTVYPKTPGRPCMMGAAFLVHSHLSLSRTQFFPHHIIHEIHCKVKLSVSSAWWPLNRGDDNGRTLTGTVKKWPWPLTRGLIWHYFLQLFGDFGYWLPYSWPLNGGSTVLF